MRSHLVRSWPGMAAHHLPGSVLARVDGSPDRHRRSVSASCGTVHAPPVSVDDRSASEPDIWGAPQTVCYGALAVMMPPDYQQDSAAPAATPAPNGCLAVGDPAPDMLPAGLWV
jgi:hypothetical protein